MIEFKFPIKFRRHERRFKNVISKRNLIPQLWPWRQIDPPQWWPAPQIVGGVVASTSNSRWCADPGLAGFDRVWPGLAGFGRVWPGLAGLEQFFTGI